MPVGMVVMHWDERIGVEILGSYPAELKVQEKTLMQLYSQHEFTGEAGMVSLFAGATNLASYYTGPDSGVYVVLVLTSEEDGDVYEEGLGEITRQILMSLEPEALKNVLPPLFQRLSVYPTLNEEQRLGMLFNSDAKRMILKRLREEVVISKSEIAIWLKDQYRDGFVDMESIISPMVKMGIAKIASVKGLSSDMVFFSSDLMITRIPPLNLIQDPTGHHLPESLAASYITEVRNYFTNHEPEERDTLQILENVVLDPACYEVLKLMREAMVTRNDLEKLKKKGVDDVDRVLKALWKTKMIAVLQDDKKVEYYCLTSDIYINKFYPRYLLDTIRKEYKTQSQNKNALLKALDLMKQDYYAMLKAKKTANKAAVAE